MRGPTSRRDSLDERERAAARFRKWNEARLWFLKCPVCEHEGEVRTTLKRLRASNIKCSACGAYLWRNSGLT
jgi:transcription elongation factor Elf1